MRLSQITKDFHVKTSEIPKPELKKKNQKRPIPPKSVSKSKKAWVLGKAYVWLTEIDIFDRTSDVTYSTPMPFREIAVSGLVNEIPKKGVWMDWKKVYFEAFDNFVTSRKEANMVNFAIATIGCAPSWQREKMVTGETGTSNGGQK